MLMDQTCGDFHTNKTLKQAGFRFGDRGTQTSRTIMLSELTELLRAVPAEAERADYASAIIEDNVLGKQTVANRRHTNQNLGELYGLDHKYPVFRVLRRLWDMDEEGHPLLAILCALTRDPLLRLAAASVLKLPQGAELVRANFLAEMLHSTGARLNPSILDKVARNAGSSLTQSGHLEGRVRKLRRKVQPTFGPAAFALWLGSLEGLAGEQLLNCRWAGILDRSGTEMIELVLQAKQKGLLHALVGGGVVEINTTRMDSFQRK